MDVKLTAEQAAFAQRRVDEGVNASIDDVLEAAFEGLIHDELFNAVVQREGIDAIRKSVHEGFAQIDRGEGQRWDLGEFLAEARARQAKASDG